MRNWCEWLAEQIRPLAVPYPVYSICDPTREYDGEVLIEFNENEYKVQTLLSGDDIRTHNLVAACRSPTFELSSALIENIKKLIEEILTNEENEGGLLSFVWDETGVSADIRGIVEGESFYGYSEFTITERVNYVC